MYDELPKHIKHAQGGDIPGPENQSIQDVLTERGYKEGRSDFARGADALSLMCQATQGELALDRIVGSFTQPSGHSEVHGIISRGAREGQLVLRLRATPNMLYSATEALLKDVARLEPTLDAKGITSVSKERGADAVFEHLELTLLRRQNTFRLFRSAQRQRLVDSIVYVLLSISVVSFAFSWTLHFHPWVLGLGSWKAADTVWLDGWIGRLGSAAIFGSMTAIGIFLSTVRQVMSEDEWVYMTFRWMKGSLT